MSRSRRLLFNFEEIFDDHRKLCYLFVNDTNYNTIRDFKLHVLSGFSIKEDIYFSDRDGVLFPDFDDIRTLIECCDIVWVKKIKGSHSVVKEISQKSVSISCSPNSFLNEDVIPTDGNPNNFEIHQNSNMNKKKKKKKREKFQGNDLERMSLDNSVTSDDRKKNNDLTPSELIGPVESEMNVNETNICERGTEIETSTKHEITTLTLSSGFNEDLSDGLLNVSTDSRKKENVYYTKNIEDCNLHDSILQNNEDVQPDGASDFRMNNSFLKNDTGGELDIENILNDSFCRNIKTKRKRKRTRKHKIKQHNCTAGYDNNDLVHQKSEENLKKISGNERKHIRFESDYTSDNSDVNLDEVSNTESSEQCSEVIKIRASNGCTKTDHKLNEHNSDVPVDPLPENPLNHIILNNSNISGSEDGSKKKFISDHMNDIANQNPKRNWDRKDKPSETIFDELLRLKQHTAFTKYFKSPVFHRTPKAKMKTKSIIWRNPQSIDSSNITGTSNPLLENGHGLSDNTVPTDGSGDANKDLGNVPQPSERTCKTDFNSTSVNGDTSLLENASNNDDTPNNSMECVSLKVDDIVNFKILFLSQDYTPTISDSIVGRVVSASDEVFKFQILLGQEICKPLGGKFSLSDSDEDGGSRDIIELHLKDLITPKKIFNPFSMLNSST